MSKERLTFKDIVHENEKVAVFIDGANLYGAAKSLNLDIDYRKLKQRFSTNTRLMRIYYYTAVMDDAEYSPVRPLVDWLDYNGYTLVTKAMREYTDPSGRKKYKGSMDIDLAVDAMSIADKVDHIVIFSGDGDFTKLADALQRKGVRVTAVSTIITHPPMIADELRRQADAFIELNDLRHLIERANSGKVYQERPAAREENYDEVELT